MFRKVRLLKGYSKWLISKGLTRSCDETCGKNITSVALYNILTYSEMENEFMYVFPSR